jgi:hypothetical protein
MFNHWTVRSRLSCPITLWSVLHPCRRLCVSQTGFQTLSAILPASLCRKPSRQPVWRPCTVGHKHTTEDCVLSGRTCTVGHRHTTEDFVLSGRTCTVGHRHTTEDFVLSERTCTVGHKHTTEDFVLSGTNTQQRTVYCVQTPNWRLSGKL